MNSKTFLTNEISITWLKSCFQIEVIMILRLQHFFSLSFLKEYDLYSPSLTSCNSFPNFKTFQAQLALCRIPWIEGFSTICVNLSPWEKWMLWETHNPSLNPFWVWFDWRTFDSGKLKRIVINIALETKDGKFKNPLVNFVIDEIESQKLTLPWNITR